MNAIKDRLVRVEVEEPVNIPTLDGTGIAETIKIRVPAWRDPKDGEIYFDGDATALLDKTKARHMGLLTPEQIRSLRKRLGLTQSEISELLQIGEKTWTRWETGRERPSRSINVLLFALNDGKLDVPYLVSVARRRKDWASHIGAWHFAEMNPWLNTAQKAWQGWTSGIGLDLAHACHVTAPGSGESNYRQGDFGFPVLSAGSAIGFQIRWFAQVQLANLLVTSGRDVVPAQPPSRTESKPIVEYPLAA